MSDKARKQLSNPYSTGSGGAHFETHVQASFLILMLADGFVPCIPNGSIEKIRFQTKFTGASTDDIMVFINVPRASKSARFFGQIKHFVSIILGDIVFGEVIQAAWDDFNDSNFSKGLDVLALVTGPLTSTDTKNVRPILEWARHSETAAEFFKKVNLEKFSSKSKREKLSVIRSHLNKANSGTPVNDQEVFEFLKHFHLLGYDFDLKEGVINSFIYSIIGRSGGIPTQIWAQAVSEVQYANENSGFVTKENLPEELKAAFQPLIRETMPTEIGATMPPANIDLGWSRLPYATDLAAINLFGSWSDKSPSDIKRLSLMVETDYRNWQNVIRDALYLERKPLEVGNGIWKVTERATVWKELGDRILDQQLDIFKTEAIKVLSEKDPQFDLPPDERFMAQTSGKAFKHSPQLRRGMAETLALLGNHGSDLKYCTIHKPQLIANVVVQEIFEDADWLTWGSLGDVLPIVAEASPRIFLESVENTLSKVPCPFDDLFSQETNGIFGRNYMTGLLWALESLAWDGEYLSSVCMILAALASRDTGGNWANRPINSLTTIFLPWMPQTVASHEKRVSVIKILRAEYPETGWQLLIHLLPNQSSVTTGTHKPAWRATIPQDWKKGVPTQQYWEAINDYCEVIIDIAKNDVAKLAQIVEKIDSVPNTARDKIIELLNSTLVLEANEDIRFSIWTNVTNVVSRHRRFSDAKWAMNKETVDRLDAVTQPLTPTNPMDLNLRLFSNQSFDLFDDRRPWEELRPILEERRRKAVRAIIDSAGDKGLMSYANRVEMPYELGKAAGEIASESLVGQLIPDILCKDDYPMSSFADSFIRSRQKMKGWEWVDEIDKNTWTNEQIGCLLSHLPFTSETWDRVDVLLGKEEKEYWTRVRVFPYEEERMLEFAADKLITYGRPVSAIDCMFALRTKSFDKDLAIKALVSAVNSEESKRMNDGYQMLEVIKALQNHPESTPEDLVPIEWSYLELIHDGTGEVTPLNLEKQLATNAEFFHSMIKLVYRSIKEKESPKEISEEQSKIATNAWKLFNEWKIPPGTSTDGDFSGEVFKAWLDDVSRLCTESGHFEVALSQIGSVLIHCPSDESGLWINQTVAGVLNQQEMDSMRDGFGNALFNSRGVHSTDPQGESEKILAAEYREQAESAEKAGYHRLATTLRNLAHSYERQSEEIVQRYQEITGTS